MKNKKIICLLFLIFLLAPFSLWAASFSYKPMENIPGFEGVANLPDYLMAIYKFGIWTIGLAAMLMIMIGGYMYIISAGNTASAGKAKGIITDAIAGLILALASWLLLYTINPELVKMNFSGNGGGVITRAECDKWCDDAGGNAEWTASCKSGCAKNTSSPIAAKSQYECEKWCDDAGGNAEWTASCKSGCSSGSTSTTASCDNLNPNLIEDLKNANSGVPPALLASFMRRECASAMSNSGACSKNNSYGAGGSMQFLDSTWKDYGCSGSKFNRSDATKCAAKKISKDSGGNYSESGIRAAAKRYCGSCTDRNACGGDYCDGIVANYNVYKDCSF